MNNNKITTDFYSWGDQSPIGLTKRGCECSVDETIINNKVESVINNKVDGVINNKVDGALDSIALTEDETTPELDYVLTVNGKDKGRVVVTPSDADAIPMDKIQTLFTKP